MIKIRFGYCPPSPGPNKNTKCKWYTDINTAIDNYNGAEIWISFNGLKYRKISINELLNFVK